MGLFSFFNQYDARGFNKNGIHKNGTKYDNNGFNVDGYNQKGFNQDGFDKSGFNKKGFDKDGYDKYGYNVYGYNINGFDRRGFNKDGFNKQGFDKDGFNKDGFGRSGFNRKGFNRNGIHLNGTKYDNNGFDFYGNSNNETKNDNKILNKTSIKTKSTYNLTMETVLHFKFKGASERMALKDIYDEVTHGTPDEFFSFIEAWIQTGKANLVNTNAFNQYETHRNDNNYDNNGYDPRGFDKNGFDKDGFKENCYDKDGYHRSGYNRRGFDISKTHKNGTKYDNNGYNYKGFDKDGFNENGYDSSGYNRRGFTRNGIHRNGTKYDAKGLDCYGSLKKETAERIRFDKLLSKYEYSQLSIDTKNMYASKGAQYLMEMNMNSQSIFMYDGLVIIGYILSKNSLGIGITFTNATFIDDIIINEIDKIKIERSNGLQLSGAQECAIMSFHATSGIIRQGVVEGFLNKDLLSYILNELKTGYAYLGNATNVI